MIDKTALRKAIPGALSEAELDTLEDAARNAHGTRALEVGHYKGLSTAVLLQSLPDTFALWTIDHHLGDKWCPPTRASDFDDNVLGYVKMPARLVTLFEPFDVALDLVPDGLEFVFYDADHSVDASDSFWTLVHPKLATRCTFLLDDSDWPGGQRLIELALRDGFYYAKSGGSEYRRESGDKGNPKTNTMEVLLRE